MENEEKDGVNLDTSNEEVTETVETPAAETTDETLETQPEVDVAQLQATNKKLFERAKKAEAEAKALREGTKASSVAPSKASPHNVEETVLLAQGMPDELLASLKKVAAVEGIGSLIKAQTNPLFVAMKSQFEKEQKQRASSMPASRGSGGVKPQKDFTTPGLTREEHMAMAKKALE